MSRETRAVCIECTKPYDGVCLCEELVALAGEVFLIRILGLAFCDLQCLPQSMSLNFTTQKQFCWHHAQLSRCQQRLPSASICKMYERWFEATNPLSMSGYAIEIRKI